MSIIRHLKDFNHINKHEDHKNHEVFQVARARAALEPVDISTPREVLVVAVCFMITPWYVNGSGKSATYDRI